MSDDLDSISWLKPSRPDARCQMFETFVNLIITIKGSILLTFLADSLEAEHGRQKKYFHHTYLCQIEFIYLSIPGLMCCAQE